jgi:hypothetical protein
MMRCSRKLTLGPYDPISDALHSSRNLPCNGESLHPMRTLAHASCRYSLFSLAAAPAVAWFDLLAQGKPSLPPSSTSCRTARSSDLLAPAPGSLHRHAFDTGRAGARTTGCLPQPAMACEGSGASVVMRAHRVGRGRSWQGSVGGRARSAVAFTEQFSRRILQSIIYRRFGRASIHHSACWSPALEARCATFSLFAETRFFTSLLASYRGKALRQPRQSYIEHSKWSRVRAGGALR